VIGGGDRAEGRIIPDCIRALERGSPVNVRNPGFVRPWQHVLEPLGGYLMLATAILNGKTDLCEAWNFGPPTADVRTVGELTDAVIDAWGEGSWVSAEAPQPHEAHTLRLATEKAQALLGWQPRWSFATAVRKTVDWYRAAHDGASPEQLRSLSIAQIEEYVAESAQ
jgi:CDP-glucose 4,6-dehydratase